MSGRVKLTRPELKRQRDSLGRFRRYLPMLKLKQQQLQLAVRELNQQVVKVIGKYNKVADHVETYAYVLNNYSGVNLKKLYKCIEVETGTENIAGVNVPVFKKAEFHDINYSLFGTPIWLDDAVADLRALSGLQEERKVLLERKRILEEELTRTLQRVNLFEKIKIPECQEAMRVIRIHLGDQMTAAVGRAKIAKGRLDKKEAAA